MAGLKTMQREIGSNQFPIWLLGDSNPVYKQDVLISPLDPRHPARHNIWTPVLDVIQDRVYRENRSRIDTSKIYIRNAVEDPSSRPPSNKDNWTEELGDEIKGLYQLLDQYRPVVLLCFGAFSFEFARRALAQEPERRVDYWKVKMLGDEFRRRIEKFDPNGINALPLLHASIARGRFIEAHNDFGEPGGNYFEFAGTKIADKLLQYQNELQIWIS